MESKNPTSEFKTLMDQASTERAAGNLAVLWKIAAGIPHRDDNCVGSGARDLGLHLQQGVLQGPTPEVDWLDY